MFLRFDIQTQEGFTKCDLPKHGVDNPCCLVPALEKWRAQQEERSQALNPKGHVCCLGAVSPPGFWVMSRPPGCWNYITIWTNSRVQHF